jgi:hypothetical protein
MTNSKIAQILALSIFGLAFSSGCSPVTFNSPPPAASTALASSTGATATPVPCAIQDVTRDVRVLFMVDDSGSTFSGAGGVGTDPNYTHRVDTVQSFIASYGQKTNITYSYSYFGSDVYSWDYTSGAYVLGGSGTAKGDLPLNGAIPANPFGDGANTLTAMAAFEKFGSDGSTNYGGAMQQVVDIINADNPASNSQSYVVIFMSDGQPTDLGSQAQELANVQSLVTQMAGYVPSGRFTFSTVYFGSEADTQSQANLKGMATAGGGQFVDTNVTTQYSIDSLINVPSQACSQ